MNNICSFLLTPILPILHTLPLNNLALIIMRYSKILTVLTFFLFAHFATAAPKSDLAKEKRWEEQIVDSLLVGDAVKLKADGTEFLGLYAEQTTDKAKGGIIIVHGIGVHPAWPDVIEPLRISMPDYGWHTLSIQMPILPNEATHLDYVPLMDEVPARIQAAVDFLKSKGIQNIVIVAHSLGNTMTHQYLVNNPDSAVRAYVAISASYYPEHDRINVLKTFPKITLPILDIYGGQDLDNVVNFARKRKQATSKNTNYTQVKIEGANHFFNQMDDTLVNRIRGWLSKNAAGTEAKVK